MSSLTCNSPATVVNPVGLLKFKKSAAPARFTVDAEVLTKLAVAAVVIKLPLVIVTLPLNVAVPVVLILPVPVTSKPPNTRFPPN